MRGKGEVSHVLAALRLAEVVAARRGHEGGRLSQGSGRIHEVGM